MALENLSRRVVGQLNVYRSDWERLAVDEGMAVKEQMYFNRCIDLSISSCELTLDLKHSTQYVLLPFLKYAKRNRTDNLFLWVNSNPLLTRTRFGFLWISP